MIKKSTILSNGTLHEVLILNVTERIRFRFIYKAFKPFQTVKKSTNYIVLSNCVTHKNKRCYFHKPHLSMNNAYALSYIRNSSDPGRKKKESIILANYAFSWIFALKYYSKTFESTIFSNCTFKKICFHI